MNEAPEAPSIAGYTIEGLLGQGSMGSVWRAVDRSGRKVAVKVADRARRLTGRERDAMFRRESIAALNVRHPGLVQGLEVGETTDGQPFLSMELVEGETLTARIAREGPRPESDLVPIGLTLAGALEHAHALGLLHRDVKPDNVMLMQDGRVKLVDLSLVAEREHGEAGCGSAGYASPEMIRRQEVGPASDLYALGVTLAAAALGRSPFPGADVKEVLRASLTRPLAIPPHVGSNRFSDAFRAIVARLGEKDPADRYASAGELRLDLEALSAGERPLGIRIALARTRAKARAGWGITAALVVLVGAGAAWLGWSSRGPERVAEPTPQPAAVTPPPVDAGDARTQAALLYVEAHPDDFVKNRELLSERLSAAPTASDRERLEDASRALEARFVEQAEVLLADRTKRARALQAAGDLDAMARALFDWPDPFAETPQARSAKTLSVRLRAEALAPGERLQEEATELLARLGVEEIDEAQDLERRLDAFLAQRGHPAAQSARLSATRRALHDRLQGLLADRQEASDRTDLAAAISRGETGAPDAGRDALARLADRAARNPTTASALAADLLRAGREADDALAAALKPVAGQPWAVVIENELFVGRLETPPSPSLVFAPAWIRPAEGMRIALECPDALAVLRDRDLVAAWLIARGTPRAARALASPESPAGRALALAGVSSVVATPEGEWGRRSARMPLLTRGPQSAVPALDPADDRILAAWLEVLRDRGMRFAPPRATPPGAAALVASARNAFLADDPVRAWRLVLEAEAAAPKDAEAAVLESRVLETLAKPLPTLGVSLRILESARRAWDLDPGIPSSARRVAELCLRFRRAYPDVLSDALVPLTKAACEEVVRLGKPDGAMLTFLVEHWLSTGKPTEAAPLARRAVKDWPDDVAFVVLLARVEAALGNAQRARSLLQDAKERFGLSFPQEGEALLKGLPSK